MWIIHIIYYCRERYKIYKDARAEIFVTVLSNTLVQSTGSGFCLLILISSVIFIVEPFFNSRIENKQTQIFSFSYFAR